MSIIDPSKDFHLLEALRRGSSKPICLFIRGLCQRGDGKSFTIHFQAGGQCTRHGLIIPDLKRQKSMEFIKPLTQQAPFPAGKGGGIGPKRKTGRAFSMFLDFYRDGSYNHVKIEFDFCSSAAWWGIIGVGNCKVARSLLLDKKVYRKYFV
jgi:hypothetical protein